MFHCILDGKPMTSEEFDAFLDDLIKNGPVPAGQPEDTVEAAWQQHKGESNGQR